MATRRRSEREQQQEKPFEFHSSCLPGEEVLLPRA